MGIKYNTKLYPRLAYNVVHPVMGIGELTVHDLENNQMEVMLQGKMASDEILKLRCKVSALEEKLRNTVGA